MRPYLCSSYRDEITAVPANSTSMPSSRSSCAPAREPTTATFTFRVRYTSTSVPVLSHGEPSTTATCDAAIRSAPPSSTSVPFTVAICPIRTSTVVGPCRTKIPDGTEPSPASSAASSCRKKPARSRASSPSSVW